MRKVITTITLCSIIFSTSIVYGQNKQVDLEKKLTENRNSQLRLDEQIIELNSKIIDTAQNNNINIFSGNTVCTDCFDLYMTDVNRFLARVPDGFNPVSAEMEAFALFYVAKLLNKKAACLMSVVDSKYIKEIATPEERQTGLNNMIKLALDSSLKL